MVSMHTTLIAELEKLAAQYPNHSIMQVKEGEIYTLFTYQGFWFHAQNIAHHLIENSIQPQDKVAIIMENRPEWGMVYFGIILAGAIAVPLDTQASASDLKYLFTNSSCKIIFTTQRCFPAMHQVLTELLIPPKAIIWEQEKIFAAAKAAHASLPKVAATDIASMLYTSGTTGKPKGVMLTQNNFYANFESFQKTGVNFSHLNILSILPLHHAFPFMANLIIPLFLQCKITYIDSLKSDVILQCLKEAEISVLTGVPQLFYVFSKQIKEQIQKLSFALKWPTIALMEINWLLRRYCNINLGKSFFRKIHKFFGGKLRYLVSGGAKLDASVAKLFIQLGFDVIEGYGLSETAPIVTFNFNNIKKLKSVGRAIPGVVIKIHDPDEKGIGEIIIQGPNIMAGYFRKPKETAEALQDGWFFTGDLGYLDEDGYLYITGRKKELIVLSSGKNISPEEVETHYAHILAIREICVLEVNENTEEKLMAVIVPDLEYCRANAIIDIYRNIKWNMENASKQLPAYRRIMGFIITKENLPRTPLGKLQRYLIREKYLNELMGAKSTPKTAKENLNEDDLSILSLPLTQKIIGILQKSARVEKNISIDDHLEIDLGIDSLGRVELLVALEKNLNCKISEEAFAKITTVKELITRVAPLQKQVQPPVITVSATQSWKTILQENLPQDLKAKISAQLSPFEKMGAALITGFVWIIFKLFWQLKLKGAENLPPDEPFILCPNHCSFLDGFAMSTAMPKWLKKRLFFLGTKMYFGVPIIKNLLKIIKVIPIDPATHLINAMQACAYVLHSGKPLCIFPEGERSIDGTPKEFKKGIGILAKETNVRLIPVYLKGTYQAWPRPKRFPRPCAITVICGKPYTASELENIGQSLGAKDDYEAIALGIREKVLELSKE